MKRTACILVFAAVLAFLLPSRMDCVPAVCRSDDVAEAAKYNRKLTRLEEKRVKREQKLEQEYRKWLEKQRDIDAIELDKRLAEFKKKLEKIQQDYQKDMAKLEKKNGRE